MKNGTFSNEILTRFARLVFTDIPYFDFRDFCDTILVRVFLFADNKRIKNKLSKKAVSKE